ncbi:MAG: hypothetical protein ACPGID_09545 [Rubricella sp.]
MRVLLLAALAFCLAMPSAAQVTRAEAEALLRLNGFDYAMDYTEELLRRPRWEDFDDAPIWERSASGLFSATEMFDTTADTISGEMAREHYETLVAFFESDAGLAVTSAEIASQLPGQDEDMQEQAGARLLQEMDAERRASLRRMREGFETGFTRYVSLQIGMTVALADFARQGETDVNPNRLLAILAENFEAQRPEREASSLAESAWTYREVSDEALAAYADLLNAPAGTAFYTLMDRGMVEALQDDFLLHRRLFVGAAGARDI